MNVPSRVDVFCFPFGRNSDSLGRGRDSSTPRRGCARDRSRREFPNHRKQNPSRLLRLSQRALFLARRVLCMSLSRAPPPTPPPLSPLAFPPGAPDCPPPPSPHASNLQYPPSFPPFLLSYKRSPRSKRGALFSRQPKGPGCSSKT
jgi:hypothetical protein